MQGLSYRRAARVRTSDRERQPRMKIARTDGGDLTFALPPPAPPAQPSPATRAAAAPVTVAAAPAAASALTGAAAASGGPRTLSAAEAAVAVAAVAAVASSAIPEDSDEMDEDYRLGVPAGWWSEAVVPAGNNFDFISITHARKTFASYVRCTQPRTSSRCASTSRRGCLRALAHQVAIGSDPPFSRPCSALPVLPR